MIVRAPRTVLDHSRPPETQKNTNKNRKNRPKRIKKLKKIPLWGALLVSSEAASSSQCVKFLRRDLGVATRVLWCLASSKEHKALKMNNNTCECTGEYAYQIEHNALEIRNMRASLLICSGRHRGGKFAKNTGKSANNTGKYGKTIYK